MRITCPKCDKNLKVADELAGKKVRCPGCKASIPVPMLEVVSDDKDDAGEHAMRCPKCDAAAVEALPPNRFSRNPGYVCIECNAVMRPPGMAGFYLFAMLLGGFTLLLGIGMMIAVIFNDHFYHRGGFGGVFIMLLGGSVAGWALNQMRLPMPVNAPAAPSMLWLWIAILAFVLVGLPCIGGVLFVGFMYFLQEMM